MCSQEYIDVDMWARRCEKVWTYPRSRKSKLEIQKETEQNVEGTLTRGFKKNTPSVSGQIFHGKDLHANV